MWAFELWDMWRFHLKKRWNKKKFYLHTPEDSFTYCNLWAGRVEQMEEELLTEQLHQYFISLLQNMYKNTQTPSIFISVPFNLAGKSACTLHTHIHTNIPMHTHSRTNTLPLPITHLTSKPSAELDGPKNFGIAFSQCARHLCLWCFQLCRILSVSYTHHTHYTSTNTPRQLSRWPKVAISHRLGPSNGRECNREVHTHTQRKRVGMSVTDWREGKTYTCWFLFFWCQDAF
jgi:hypothetical protein